MSPKSRFDLFRLIISILKIGRKNTDKNLKNISSYEFTKKYLKNKDLFFLCNALSWMSTGCSIKEGSLCRFADTIARDKTFSLSYLLNSIKKKSDALEGDFYPIGGLKKIPKLFESLNFEIHKNEEIKKILIRNNKVSGIKTNKTQYKADIVIYTGKVLELKKIASEYKGKFPKNEEYKAITLWLGLNKKIAYFGKNSHIIIKNDESSPLWFMDLTSFDSNLSPKGKQLIGISTILHKDKNLILKDMKQTAGKLMPDYKKYLEMEKVMIDRAEKTLQTYNNPLWDLPEQRTNIKGLYLAGTDTKAFGSGGTMCAGSAYSCINFIEKDFKLLKSN